MKYTREELECEGLDSVTISPGSAWGSEHDCQYEVYGHGESDGHPRRVLLAIYSTVEDAKRDYPWAEVHDGRLPAAWLELRATSGNILKGE